MVGCRNLFQWFHLIILISTLGRLGAVSITTLSGPQLDKSLTVTWKWRLDAGAGDVATGNIAFDEGLEVLGGGTFPAEGVVTLGVSFPIKKILDLSTDWISWARKISLTQDLHLAEGLVIYLPDQVGGGSIAFGGLYLGSYSGQQRTIYLDGDVSLASRGQTVLRLENVIVDGQGHVLTLGNSQQSGAILCNNVVLRNMTLKNAWNEFLDGVFTQEGTFFINGPVTFKNMDFQVLRGYPFGITSGTIRVEGDVIFGNFGQYRLSNYDTGSAATFTIAENSNLIIDNSSLYRNWYTFAPYNIVFEADTSLLTLQNSSFGVDNDRWKSFFAGWIGVADQDPLILTKGKIIAKGASSLVAYGTGLDAGARARLYLGDGSDSDNDLNIEITPGSSLDLDVSDTNCLIKVQNVH